MYHSPSKRRVRATPRDLSRLMTRSDDAPDQSKVDHKNQKTRSTIDNCDPSSPTSSLSSEGPRTPDLHSSPARTRQTTSQVPSLLFPKSTVFSLHNTRDRDSQKNANIPEARQEPYGGSQNAQLKNPTSLPLREKTWHLRHGVLSSQETEIDESPLFYSPSRYYDSMHLASLNDSVTSHDNHLPNDSPFDTPSHNTSVKEAAKTTELSSPVARLRFLTARVLAGAKRSPVDTPQLPTHPPFSSFPSPARLNTDHDNCSEELIEPDINSLPDVYHRRPTPNPRNSSFSFYNLGIPAISSEPNLSLSPRPELDVFDRSYSHDSIGSCNDEDKENHWPPLPYHELYGMSKYPSDPEINSSSSPGFIPSSPSLAIKGASGLTSKKRISVPILFAFNHNRKRIKPDTPLHNYNYSDDPPFLANAGREERSCSPMDISDVGPGVMGINTAKIEDAADRLGMSASEMMLANALDQISALQTTAKTLQRRLDSVFAEKEALQTKEKELVDVKGENMRLKLQNASLSRNYHMLWDRVRDLLQGVPNPN